MDGVVIINKPKGYTSNDIVQITKKKLKQKKVGHAGTLDPMATGVLPILIGQGTKISKYLIEHKKTYIATIKLGQKTDTADAEGTVIEQKEIKEFSKKDIIYVLNSFKGVQQQKPPMYSAIKVNGKKLYEYARENEQVEIATREIEIYGIDLISHTEDTITYQVECSKGTYIRTLSEDIVQKLGTVGYMEKLTRTKVNEFELEQAIELEELEKDFPIITIEEIFSKNSEIMLSEKKLQLFLNGVKLTCNNPNGVYRIYCEDKFIGLGVIENNLLKRDVIV